MTELRWRERRALAELQEVQPEDQRLDTVVAVLDGLRGAVCAPVSAMRVDRAQDLLRTVSAAVLPRPR